MLLAALLWLAGCTTLPEPIGALVPAGDFEIMRAPMAGRAARQPSPDPNEMWGSAQAANRRRILVIEGDGRAWPAPDRAPLDPTPRSSVALDFARRLQRTAGRDAEIIYLGRPCQYRGRYRGKVCESRWWTTDRFTEPVLEAYHHLIDRLQRSAPTTLCLAGHSGGGLIALLIAGQRPDVLGVMTMASPVAVDAWTSHHRLTALPLANGLARGIARLPGQRQIHFLGDDDAVVPLRTVLDPTRALVGASRVMVIKGAQHAGPWTLSEEAPIGSEDPLLMPVSAWCAEGS